jgi:hypothetical protein
VGAAAGILYGVGNLSDADLLRVALGYLGSTATDARKSSGILRGLLATSREVAWQVTELMRGLDSLFGDWSEETFLSVLPELRLAFADLTPREISRVAEHVAGMHNQLSLGELVHSDLHEGDVRLSLEINRVVQQSLQNDGVPIASVE